MQIEWIPFFNNSENNGRRGAHLNDKKYLIYDKTLIKTFALNK